MHSGAEALGSATSGSDACADRTRSKNVNNDSKVTDQALPRFSTYSLITAKVRGPASELNCSTPTGSGTFGRGVAWAKKRPTSSSTFGPLSTLRSNLSNQDDPYKIVELLCSSGKKRGSSEPGAASGSMNSSPLILAVSPCKARCSRNNPSSVSANARDALASRNEPRVG